MFGNLISLSPHEFVYHNLFVGSLGLNHHCTYWIDLVDSDAGLLWISKLPACLSDDAAAIDEAAGHVSPNR
ncbi:hypothetical protein Bca4012_032157 [Brassica carinata]